MYNLNYGGFDYFRIHFGIANVSAKPKINVYLPVTDGYTRPLAYIQIMNFPEIG